MKTPSDFQVPDAYWRVSIKAFIFDADQRLLVLLNKNHQAEIPGGGWEHDETWEQCIRREMIEETGAGVASIGDILFCYPGRTSRGFPKMSVAVKVVLDGSPRATDTADGFIEPKFVTKEEFLRLPFQFGEETVQAYAEQIWA